MTDERAEPLTGGNATAGVVRIGDSVRKPWLPGTDAVVEFIDALRARGVDAPRHLGRDEAGRQIIEFIPGRMADAVDALALDDLARIGGMIRAIHDASEGLPWPDDGPEPLLPAPGGARDLVCHGDLTPWNLVLGERWVFIDWDGAAPSTRLWDLSYSAQAFAALQPAQPVEVGVARLRALIDGYGADAALRSALVDALAPRAAAMHAMLRDAHAAGIEPWGAMYVDAHGAYWASVAEHLAANRAAWAAALAVG